MVTYFKLVKGYSPNLYRSKLLSTTGQTLEESLSQLLAPIMDTITTAQNRVYLSQDIVNNALSLLLSLVGGVVGGVMSGKDNEEVWKGMKMVPEDNMY